MCRAGANPEKQTEDVTQFLSAMLGLTLSALRDLAPIILVIAFFQVVVLRQPFPDLLSVLIGLLCVIAGLTLFIQGLESGLFPLGEALAQGFAQKGNAIILLAFGFCLGFGTTIAEPALIAVAAAVAAEAGAIANDDSARQRRAAAQRGRRVGVRIRALQHRRLRPFNR